jgi:hypothetical protein
VRTQNRGQASHDTGNPSGPTYRSRALHWAYSHEEATAKRTHFTPPHPGQCEARADTKPRSSIPSHRETVWANLPLTCLALGLQPRGGDCETNPFCATPSGTGRGTCEHQTEVKHPLTPENRLGQPTAHVPCTGLNTATTKPGATAVGATVQDAGRLRMQGPGTPRRETLCPVGCLPASWTGDARPSTFDAFSLLFVETNDRPLYTTHTTIPKECAG